MRLNSPGHHPASVIARCLIVVILALWTPGLVWAGESKDLSQLSIEELMNIEITSVSKKSEPLSKAPAAAYVITSDDIRRTGYTSVPDLLRLVPGLEVARIDLNTWAITARGFNGQYASKLLVLIDGRSVYSPLFSGVFWDQQDLVLDDIDRIEVIRGPGATMWGANAVNGVINIITKESSQTQGVCISGDGGTEQHYGASVRYGGKLGNKTSYRIYAKGYNRLQQASETVVGVDDRWQSGRGGFRLDMYPGAKGKLTILGDISSSAMGMAITTPQLTPPYSMVKHSDAKKTGGYLLTRYEQTFSPLSQATLQIYYDRINQNGILFNDKGELLDLDFQHRWSGLKNNEFVWGVGCRVTGNRIGTTDVVSPTYSWQSTKLFSGFIQDEITIVNRRVRFTLGSKFERNDMTRFEVQPNARVLWTPHERHTVWSSVSRAVRTPSVGERNASIIMAVIPPMSPYNPSPLPVQTSILSSPDFTSEKLVAYEMGYRIRPTDELGITVDGFYNDYSDLRTFGTSPAEPQLGGAIPYILVPLNLSNDNEGHSKGLEFSVDWRPAGWWRLLGAYTYLTSHSLPTKAASVGSVTEDVIPESQAWIRSSFDIGEHFELDVIPRYVSRQQNSKVGEYFTCDLRAGWNPNPAIRVFAAGQNLVGGKHFEFDAPFSLQTVASKTGPAVYAGMTFSLGNHRISQ